MADLIDALGSSVAGAVAPQAAALGPAPSLLPKQVFQLSEHPILIDRARYEGAASPTNPGGDIPKLYRQSRDLLDPLPTFQRAYSPGAFSFEQIYEYILFGANLAADAPNFERTYFDSARQTFTTSSLSALTPDGAHFHAAYALPDDWYDVSKVTEEVTVSVDDPSPLDGLATIGSAAGNVWRFPGLPGELPVSGGSALKRVTLKFRYIKMNRPWFNPLMLLQKHWSLDGLAPGQISSGALDNNGGIMPLIPIGFIVATDIKIEAEWQGKDAAIVDLVRRSGTRASLGPFVFGSGPKLPPMEELRTALSPLDVARLTKKPTLPPIIDITDLDVHVVDLPANNLALDRFRMDKSVLRALGERNNTFGLKPNPTFTDPIDPEPIEWHLPFHPGLGHVHPPPPTLPPLPDTTAPLASQDLQIIAWISLLVPYWPAQ